MIDSNRKLVAEAAPQYGWDRLFFCPNYEVWRRGTTELTLDFFSTGRLSNGHWAVYPNASSITPDESAALGRSFPAVLALIERV